MIRIILVMAVVLMSYLSASFACTRALYVGDDNTVIVGRSMDWDEDMHTNLWVFPRGISRNGLAGTGSLTWKSKYGSLIASVYQLASADGMNEKGLVMNLLYLAESNYGDAAHGRPPMSISMWGQYVLDNFASVQEAVTALQAKPFYLIAPKLPNGVASTVHLSISDSTGDSAIFEYVNGELIVHHGKQYKIMTNSPIYSKQLALNEYWQSIGGTAFLPGTSRAADRFARAAFFLAALPKSASQNFAQQPIANVLSLIRAVSVPLGITTPNQPNIASTIWRSVSDQTNRMYYFDSATKPNTFWVSLDKLNFTEGAPILSLPLEHEEVYAGEVAALFKPTPAFKFMPAVSSL